MTRPHPKLAVVPASETWACAGLGDVREGSQATGGCAMPAGGHSSRKSKRAIEKQRHDEMTERMKAEQARGWPRSAAKVWTDDTQGYLPLDDIPVRDEVEFGFEGMEQVPPDEVYLPERGAQTADMFDGMDKVERRRWWRGRPYYQQDVA